MGNTVSRGVNPSPSNEYRFLNIDKEPLTMLGPIESYQNLPLVSLEQAVSSLSSFVPEINQMVQLVKAKCQNPADKLTIDESASIMLYTLEWTPINESFYVILNKTLRDKNRENLKKWFSYLKLFTTALSKIPSTNYTVFCGTKRNLDNSYRKGAGIIWWGFSSCITSSRKMSSEEFVGKNGPRTIFIIKCTNGKNIQNHSYYPTRNEILLLSEIKFEIDLSQKHDNGLSIIRLKEVPKLPLVESTSSISKRSVVNSSTVQTNNTNTNITTQTQTQTTKSAERKSDWIFFKWVKNMFNESQDTNTKAVMPTKCRRNYSELYKKRRPCSQCGREDQVFRADLLFVNRDSFFDNITAFHILSFPRLSSRMFQAGLLNDQSFVCIYGILFFSPPAMIRYLSTRHFCILLTTCVFTSAYMLYRLVTNVVALGTDVNNGGRLFALNQYIGAQSKLCFFRSMWDAFFLVYICTHKH